MLIGFIEPNFHLCELVLLDGGKYCVCLESALKDLFHSLELSFFECVYDPSILMNPKACTEEPYYDVLKQVGEISAFHVLLRQLIKLGKAMLLKELVNVFCSGDVSLLGVTVHPQASVQIISCHADADAVGLFLILAIFMPSGGVLALMQNI